MTTWQWRDSNSQPYDCGSCILTTAPSQLDRTSSQPGKNWNINETSWFNTLWVSINAKKSWQSLKIGRVLFQANFQNGRHRPYWKMNFWYTGPTIMCNMSFLTNLMMTNPFSILILQSEVYLTLYAAYMYEQWEMAPMSMTLLTFYHINNYFL